MSHDPRMRDHTENEYLAHLHGFDDELLDPVATYAEWARFHRAALRWLDDHQREWDERARDDEHGGDR